MLNSELKKNLRAIHNYFNVLKDTYGVKRIGVFGSTVRGFQRRQSDIDILVEFSRPIGFFKFIELEDLLANLLKKKVDLATRNALKTSIKKQVLKEVVYA